jgi:hypothetical protein
VGTDTLVEKLKQVLDLGQREQRKKLDKLRSLLKKMRERERELKKELDTERRDKRSKRLKRDLKVLHAQRTKGVKLYRRLRDGD